MDLDNVHMLDIALRRILGIDSHRPPGIAVLIDPVLRNPIDPQGFVIVDGYERNVSDAA